MLKKFAALFVMLLFASPLYAKDVGGVSMPESISAGGKTLTLNGAGVRKKYGLVSVYAAGLYLVQKSSDAEKIMAADEPMAIEMVWIRDNVEQSAVNEAWHEGFARAMNGNAAPLKAQIEKFIACFPATYHKKDSYRFTYVPGTGTTVEVNGQKKAVIPGLAFKKALFGNWLAPGGDGGLTKLRPILLGK